MPRRLLVCVLFASTAWPVAVGADSVQVVDAQEQPVEDARLELWMVPEPGSLLGRVDALVSVGDTGDAGKVDLAVPRSGRLVLVVDPPGRLPEVLPVTAPLPPRLRLKGGSRLVGFARPEPSAATVSLAAAHSSEAQPSQLEGTVCVRWTREMPGLGRDREWNRCGIIAATGEFALTGLPQEPVAVTVQVPGFLPAHQHPTPGGEPIAVLLEEGIRLRGRVVGPRGEPVTAAVVEAGPDLRATSGSDGGFLLSVPRLPARLEVSADGYRETERKVAAGQKPRALEIRLDRGQGVTGEILGAGGAVEKATFRIERDEGEAWVTAGSYGARPEEGRFRVPLAESGLYRFRLQIPGYRETAIPEVAVRAGEDVDLGTIVASPGAGVRGRLIDEETGEPVAGGLVEIVPRGSQLVDQMLRGEAPRVVSGADGSFVLTGLEAGSYDLRARVRGRAPSMRTLDLAQDEVEELGDVALGTGVTLSGRVSDRSGGPRVGVRVSFYAGDGDSLEPIGTCTTDTDGWFEGPALAAGAYQVRVEAERRLLTQRIEIPAGVDRHELDLIAGGVAIHGLVTHHGAPVDGGLLVLTSELDPNLRRGAILLSTHGGRATAQDRFNVPESQLAADVGPDGTFEVEDAPAGPLLARFYGFEGREITRRLEVPDESEAWISLDLEGAELTGAVLDDTSGAGVEAAVRLLTPSGQPAGATASDASGRFVLGDLEPGFYRVEVSAAGYRSYVGASVRVDPGGEPLVVRLEPGAAGALAVELERTDGSPLSRVQFTLLDSNGVMVRSLLSDWDGQKRFEDLTDGDYVLVWSDVLSGTGASGPVRVEAGETTSFQATLPEASPVSLACDPSVCGGEGVDFLQVLVPTGLEITPYLSGAQPALRFSDDGRLALGRLTPGRYLLRAVVAGLRADHVLDVRGGNVVVALK